MSTIDECCICLENLDDKYQKYLLECKHQFHTTCLNEWYQKPNSNYMCPMCNLPSNIINVSSSNNIIKSPIVIDNQIIIKDSTPLLDTRAIRDNQTIMDNQTIGNNQAIGDKSKYSFINRPVKTKSDCIIL
uniref:RING-type E3 ubiquitin transferase n=1 Tax=viral metagenome TaxID=1070528 RepID=A0A6C0EL23_9ZZZZ